MEKKQLLLTDRGIDNNVITFRGNILVDGCRWYFGNRQLNGVLAMPNGKVT